MGTVQRAIDVRVPIRTAYERWTRFEDFPLFMEGVESVVRYDDVSMSWVARVAGARREWDAEITASVPNRKVAWQGLEGAADSGVVTFHRLGPETTRVLLRRDFGPEWEEPDMARRADGDLRRFRALVERGRRDRGGAGVG